jgi:hypothetical protein
MCKRCQFACKKEEERKVKCRKAEQSTRQEEDKCGGYFKNN